MTYYNKISKGYDELYKEEQLKKMDIIKKNLIIKKDYKLLDVGCGIGISSDFDCEVYGLDSSKKLLSQIKNKKIKKILGKAENIPFHDNFFDIVISVTAIHNFNNIKKGLLEMKRVCKNKFVFSVLKRSRKFNFIKRLIKNNFKINKTIEEDKDIIFFCEK